MKAPSTSFLESSSRAARLNPRHRASLRKSVAAGDEAAAFAAVSAALAAGDEPGADGEWLAERLLRRGFRSVARVLGAPAVVLIAAAEDTRPARTGDLEVLASALDRALMSKAIPKEFLGRAHHARGRLLARAGRLSDAAEAFRNSLAHEPEAPLVASELAEVLLCEGEIDQARAFLNLAKDNGDGARRIVVEAMLAEHEGDLVGAAGLLDRAATTLEQSANGRRRAFADACIEASRQMGLPENAPLLDLMNLDADATPWPGGEATALRRRGALLADRAGALPEAQEHLSHFGDGVPRDVDLASVAARSALLLGDADAALKAVMLPDAERTPSLATLGGIAMLDLGRHSEGAFVLASSAQEGCPAASVALAWVAVEQGRLDHADAHLRHGLRASASSVMKARVGAMRAELREAAGDGLGAVCVLAEALGHGDDPVLRARYVTLTVDMALRAHDDPHARQHFLDRALDAVRGSDVGDTLAALPVAIAEWMSGLPPRVAVKEIDRALSTSASLSAADTRCALRHEDWLRVRRDTKITHGTPLAQKLPVDVRRHGILPKSPSMIEGAALRRLAIVMTRGGA